MDLLLQKDLPHQKYAVNAVSKVFENVAVGVPSFYYMNPLVNIKDSNIKSNITELQKSVDNAKCSYLPAKDYLHIDIKMETGTGKTFVYTKTIFELHQRYGFNKFVIAVPSLPIKEGTKSFIEDSYVRKFFADTCGYDCEIELCTVDAAKKQKKGKKYFPYDKVRADLKSTIEATQLTEVYTFEEKGASTLSAGAYYRLALKDSDLCIF